MTEGSRVLVVDDDDSVRDFLEQTLGDEGYIVHAAADTDQALELVRAWPFEAVVTDVHMGRRSGIELCRAASEMRPDLPIVVLTAYGNLEVAVEALRAGAFDFLGKPIDVDLLIQAVKNAVERCRLTDEVRRLREELSRRSDAGCAELIGESAAIQRVRRLVERVARTESSVLITGESGTGKEVVAKLLHRLGRRAERPFLGLNMTSFPDQLLESQLFGHAKGAFTDAKATSAGLFAEADGGTLFLDEIGDMPLTLQPKLLRVLQERRYRPVGGAHELDLDVRVIAATHRDMDAALEDGAFRRDLFFRLNVVQIELPPLRERDNDVLLLAQHFIVEHAARLRVEPKAMSPDVARVLMAYPWPGNVRELSNCIERAVALAEMGRITVEDLPDRVRGGERGAPPALGQGPGTIEPQTWRLEDVERAHILRVYAQCRHNKVQTAEVLGIDRKTLYRKLERYLDGAPMEPTPPSGPISMHLA